MNNMTNIKLSKFTKHLLDFMFYSGILICLALPYIFQRIRSFYPTIDHYYIAMCILFECCGIFSLMIIFELRKIFRSVLTGNPFVTENVTSLRKMSYYGIVIALISIIRLFVVVTPATVVVIIVFTIASLFSTVLSQVFHQAILYKDENDLTI